MVASELLELLCCPETHQALHIATPEQLEKVNLEGTVNRAGTPVRLPIPAGLIREDGAVLYPVWDDIPCLLIEEGIPLKSAASQA